jgi:hypothetical protein
MENLAQWSHSVQGWTVFEAPGVKHKAYDFRKPGFAVSVEES